MEMFAAADVLGNKTRGSTQTRTTRVVSSVGRPRTSENDGASVPAESRDIPPSANHREAPATSLVPLRSSEHLLRRAVPRAVQYRRSFADFRERTAECSGGDRHVGAR